MPARGAPAAAAAVCDLNRAQARTTLRPVQRLVDRAGVQIRSADIQELAAAEREPAVPGLREDPGPQEVAGLRGGVRAGNGHPAVDRARLTDWGGDDRTAADRRA